MFLPTIADDDDDVTATEPPPLIFHEPPLTDCTDHSLAQISLNALSGMLAPKTFRILGQIAHSQVTILADGGSMHNFVQTRVAKFLGLQT